MYPNWLQSRIISSDVLKNKFLKISFSQDGEDDFIRSFFWDQILSGYKGTYVDIGCYDESLYSNTKLLSLLGWSGVAVDANPDTIRTWTQKRPDDIFINTAIKASNESDSSVSLFRFKDGALNTINIKTAKSLIHRGMPFTDKVIIQAMSLKELSLKIKQQYTKNPDFVNIDIEFVDYLDELPEFLQILGRPKLICLEMVSTNITIGNFKLSREYSVLTEANYKVIGIVGKNFFVTSETPHPTQDLKI